MYSLDSSAETYIGSNYPFLMEPGMEGQLAEQIDIDPKLEVGDRSIKGNYTTCIVSFNEDGLDYCL